MNMRKIILKSTDEDTIAKKAERLQQLKADREQIDADIKALQSEVVAGMKSLGVGKVANENVSATLVEPVRLNIDESGLAEALGKKWLKVSVRVLDKKKLEAAVTTGEVDPQVVAANSTETATAPYVRLAKGRKGAK